MRQTASFFVLAGLHEAAALTSRRENLGFTTMQVLIRSHIARSSISSRTADFEKHNLRASVKSRFELFVSMPGCSTVKIAEPKSRKAPAELQSSYFGLSPVPSNR